MVTRSKDIGTRAEAAVVRYLCANGWANAERRALRGSADWGDVVSEAEDLIDDIVDYLVNYYSGNDTGFDTLDDLVLADADALFNEDFEER